MTRPADAALQIARPQAPAEKCAHRRRPEASSHEQNPCRPVSDQANREQCVEQDAERRVRDAEQRRSRRSEEDGASAVFELADLRPRQPSGQDAVVAPQRGDGRRRSDNRECRPRSGRRWLACAAPVGESRITSLCAHADRRSTLAARVAGATVDPEPLLRIGAAGRSSKAGVGGQLFRDVRGQEPSRRRHEARTCSSAQQFDLRERTDTRTRTESRTCRHCRSRRGRAGSAGRRRSRCRCAHGYGGSPRRRRSHRQEGPARAAAARRGAAGPSTFSISATGMSKPTATKSSVATTIRIDPRGPLPALAGTIDVPAAVHAHVRSQQQAATEFHQDVFPRRTHPAHHRPVIALIVMDARQVRETWTRTGPPLCPPARD